MSFPKRGALPPIPSPGKEDAPYTHSPSTYIHNSLYAPLKRCCWNHSVENPGYTPLLIFRAELIFRVEGYIIYIPQFCMRILQPICMQLISLQQGGAVKNCVRCGIYNVYTRLYEFTPQIMN